MAKNNLEVGMRCIKYMLLCVTAIFVVSTEFAYVISALFCGICVADSCSIGDKMG